MPRTSVWDWEMDVMRIILQYDELDTYHDMDKHRSHPVRLTATIGPMPLAQPMLSNTTFSS